MTIQEWITKYKDDDNEYIRNFAQDVERIQSLNESGDNINISVADVDDIRLRIQYETALTDPRRI